MSNLIGYGCSAWKLFLDLKPDTNLLVLGCGLGNLVNNLAPNVGRLFALDFEHKRLPSEGAGLSTCATQENNPLVGGDDITVLPFADNYIDCVVLSGALEFSAPGMENPRAMQQKLLREVRRVVKPEGQVFVGADNRFSYERIRGGPEAYSFSRSLLRRPQEIRTHSYSYRGYKRLLKDAGFPQCEFLGLLKGRRLVTEIVPQDDNFPGWQAPRGDSWRDRLKRSRCFVPAYGIIASECPKPCASLENRIFSAVSEALHRGQNASAELSVHKYEITGKQKLVVHASSGDQRLLIKHTFDIQGTNSEHNNHAILTWLSDHRPELPAVPRPITSGEISNQVFFAETAVQGRPLRQIVQGEKRVDIVKAAMAFLLKINPPELAEHAVFDDALFEEYVGKRLTRVFPLLQEAAQQGQLLAFFKEKFLGKSLFLGVAHGDFGSSNILFDGNEVSGVFDWEAGAVRNIPALDGISLLISVHRAAGANLSLAECLAMLATRQWPDAVEFRFLMELYAAMGIDEHCHAGIVYLSWLNGMELRLRYGMDKDPHSVEMYIHNVVAKIGLG